MANPTLKSGFKKTVFVTLAAVAAGSDSTVVGARAPFGGTVESVNYIPNALITGVVTNTRKLTVVNKKADASGVAVVAELQFNNGVNAPAFVEKTITAGIDAALVVAAGDILSVTSLHVGTGLADPGGVLAIKFARV